MAEFTFVFSAMKSGKSLDLLKNAHQYKERGGKVLLFTSEVDTRNNRGHITQPKGVIQTRLGPSAEAWLIERTDICGLVREEKPDIVFVDEAQFLKVRYVLSLAEIVDEQNIPVTAYGLKTDFQGDLFPGSEALIRYASSLQELETKCWYCLDKATMNLRVDKDGTPVFTGNQISIGDNYYPVCRSCYLRFKKMFMKVA